MTINYENIPIYSNFTKVLRLFPFLEFSKLVNFQNCLIFKIVESSKLLNSQNCLIFKMVKFWKFSNFRKFFYFTKILQLLNLSRLIQNLSDLSNPQQSSIVEFHYSRTTSDFFKFASTSIAESRETATSISWEHRQATVRPRWRRRFFIVPRHSARPRISSCVGVSDVCITTVRASSWETPATAPVSMTIISSKFTEDFFPFRHLAPFITISRFNNCRFVIADQFYLPADHRWRFFLFRCQTRQTVATVVRFYLVVVVDVAGRICVETVAYSPSHRRCRRFHFFSVNNKWKKKTNKTRQIKKISQYFYVL